MDHELMQRLVGEATGSYSLRFREGESEDWQVKKFKSKWDAKSWLEKQDNPDMEVLWPSYESFVSESLLDDLEKFFNTTLKPGRNVLFGWPVDIEDGDGGELWMAGVDLEVTKALMKHLRNGGFAVRFDKKSGQFGVKSRAGQMEATAGYTISQGKWGDRPEIKAAIYWLNRLKEVPTLPDAQSKVLAQAATILSRLDVVYTTAEAVEEGLTDYDFEALSKDQLQVLIAAVEKLWRSTQDDNQKAVLKKAMTQFAKAYATAA